MWWYWQGGEEGYVKQTYEVRVGIIESLRR
jgi:hypothetical protein